MKLGFPVICIDRFSQIKPAIEAVKAWIPGTSFPENIGAKIPELDITALPRDQGELDNMDDYGDTYEPEDPSVLAGFFDLDKGGVGD